jgi:hypothetical protein
MLVPAVYWLTTLCSALIFGGDSAHIGAGNEGGAAFFSDWFARARISCVLACIAALCSALTCSDDRTHCDAGRKAALCFGGLVLDA